MSSAKPTRLNLPALLVAATFNAFFYAFIEWIFFVTKPSALSLLSPFEKARIFFVTGGVIALAIILVCLPLLLPALLTKDKTQRRLATLACLPPAFVASVNALIITDNFTYTVFKFGIATAEDYWRIPYAIGFILFFLWTTRQTHRRLFKRRVPASSLTLSGVVLTLSLVLALTSPRADNVSAANDPAATSQTFPNIIIIGGDGLGSTYLSAYGNPKKTTPFLEKLAAESIFAENAFVNVSSTTASTTSMLTGRYPADVDVFRYPDVLSGDDSFKHLPGILKAYGYHTVEVGVNHYVDAGKINLLDGFDIVNGRSLNQPLATALRKVLGNTPSTQFMATILSRAEERLLHIFFVRSMSNAIKEVEDPHARDTDGQRVDEINQLFDQADRPLFIFAHFMDTHGPHFSYSQQVFSKRETARDWDVNQYQDAILTFDGNLKKIYNHLEETGKLENTIIVIYTDHGFMYTVTSRIPLIVRFPEQAHAGTRSHNLQVIDVPATLLDYLGLPQPEWMSGASFLEEEAPALREIISIVAGSPKKIKPPFFQIKSVVFTVCQKYYSFNVQENKFTTKLVTGHTAPCDPASLPLEEDIRAKIIAYLEAHGYDVSGLQDEAERPKEPGSGQN
ncbi:MAG: sulfatase-like hydrolase/transferase [Chloroflexi bacterium]|nr:sulfatase-like hydrolase/transferase [Chloroflexota bacterium]